jgi:hypothetical protein
MYQNFPGFNAFREATKFYYVTAIGYGVLIGSFAAYVHETSYPGFLKNAAKWSVLALTALLFLYNARPIVSGEMGNLFVERQIHRDYLLLRDHIVDQNSFFRTFWLPSTSRWGYYSDMNPRLVNGDVLP